MNEFWRQVVGYEGLYEVSNFGKVRSLDRYVKHPRGDLRLKGRILKQQIDHNGYLFVSLSKNGKVKMFRIHRLVAQAFIPNPDNLPMVNHKDENPLNNQVFNLEWCTAKYNINYGTGIERMTEKRSKPVIQYSLDGTFVREWSSMAEAGRNGFILANISACCQGKNKTHKGYKWEYK